MGREERIITDYHECGTCHVDALLCCVFSSSSYLFMISHVFFIFFFLVLQEGCGGSVCVCVSQSHIADGESMAQSGKAMRVFIQKWNTSNRF